MIWSMKMLDLTQKIKRDMLQLFVNAWMKSMPCLCSQQWHRKNNRRFNVEELMLNQIGRQATVWKLVLSLWKLSEDHCRSHSWNNSCPLQNLSKIFNHKKITHNRDFWYIQSKYILWFLTVDWNVLVWKSSCVQQERITSWKRPKTHDYITLLPLVYNWITTKIFP